MNWRNRDADTGVSLSEDIIVRNASDDSKMRAGVGLADPPQFCLQDRDRVCDSDSLGGCMLPTSINHVPDTVGELRVGWSGWTCSI